MTYRIILSPGAQEGIRSALLWYFHQDRDLPFRFQSELKSTLSRIARYPYLFPVESDPLRRARMKRFPYLIHFKVNTGIVYVVNFFHQRQLNPLSRP